MSEERIEHPPHYGGKDDTYEAIKVIENWGLGFCLGNTVKYICRAEKKGAPIDDLRKALWYLNHEIEQRLRDHPEYCPICRTTPWHPQNECKGIRR